MSAPGSMSTSPAASQPSRIDTMDSLLDLSEYDTIPFQSPSLSPAASSKTPFTRPVKTEANTPSLLSTGPQMSGPSHQYDLYKQQTGIVPGALASTVAVNQNNAHIQGYTGYGLGYLDMGNTDDIFNFNTDPSQASITSPDMDMADFDSPPSDPSFFFDSTVNPSVIGGQEPSSLPSPPVLSTPTTNVGRVWPGMHSQAAMAKAQQQQRQKVQAQQAKQTPRQKSAQPSDPIVEQKITQLLNSMRAKSSSDDGSQNLPLLNVPRPRKDEDDMDEDERLLASEEGKKLTSKERRQLRNKVSARAFRSRRKEYITQLEAEIANKVTENGDLRAQNRALVDENKRLSDLTRMLLSSPSFSDFLDQLSSNPQQLPQPPQQPIQQQQQPQQQEQPRQLPKDVNPYAMQQQMQNNQQIGLAMIPEQNMDFSMLNLDTIDGFNYQPHVFTAMVNAEPPTIDASLLSGKTSNFVLPDSDDEKVEMPVISERPSVKQPKEEAVVVNPTPVDDEFENDPAFALYHETPATVSGETVKPVSVEFDTEGLSNIDIFGGIEPEKAFARIELVDATAEEANATMAMARVQRISANLEAVMARLECLTIEF
ncbi:hypothetical protein B0H66DRAFT_346436 [Apodospora peruviana]|uniref:BZIP domain-containing protein n=1 Tax=Apodospora peruviana TaxID=516989 RepID=A0AAE0I0V3_9PEZI|nr:hypothetical protein B0H66DRAFT_346436 [Apodospora peruviana]